MESIPIPSSSESSNDDSDDDIGVLPEKEKDPENVEFNFLRTGIAKQIDFLCFKLDNLFKFTKNNYSNTFIFSNIPSLCKHKLISDWFPTSRKTYILSPFLNLKNML